MSSLCVGSFLSFFAILYCKRSVTRRCGIDFDICYLVQLNYCGADVVPCSAKTRKDHILCFPVKRLIGIMTFAKKN